MGPSAGYVSLRQGSAWPEGLVSFLSELPQEGVACQSLLDRFLLSLEGLEEAEAQGLVEIDFGESDAVANDLEVFASIPWEAILTDPAWLPLLEPAEEICAVLRSLNGSKATDREQAAAALHANIEALFNGEISSHIPRIVYEDTTCEAVLEFDRQSVAPFFQELVRFGASYLCPNSYRRNSRCGRCLNPVIRRPRRFPCSVSTVSTLNSVVATASAPISGQIAIWFLISLVSRYLTRVRHFVTSSQPSWQAPTSTR